MCLLPNQIVTRTTHDSGHLNNKDGKLKPLAFEWPPIEEDDMPPNVKCLLSFIHKKGLTDEEIWNISETHINPGPSSCKGYGDMSICAVKMLMKMKGLEESIFFDRDNDGFEGHASMTSDLEKDRLKFVLADASVLTKRKKRQP
ncbi:hypothetical protein Dip518_001299 [Parelusimicrobium proximum]|uniref:hypothetical protein n=1 Tax=Parelusimicrobium proximum TaxID=3228953 RepID=UPI003D16549A